MHVSLSITEKQLRILKELVADELNNDCPNTRDECDDLYNKVCCMVIAIERSREKRRLKRCTLTSRHLAKRFAHD